MSHDTKKLLTLANRLELEAFQELAKTAKEKEKKLDPKAKVRNRGTVCIPAENAKDKKDHFPINDEAQARNALARVQQYSSAPSWYSGSLKGLQDLVSRKVHSKYPGIGKVDKKKSSAKLEIADILLNKYAQEFDYESPPEAGDIAPTGWGVKNDEPFIATPTRDIQPGKTIDPTFQTMLGVNPDGQLGPQTKAALDRYKASRNPNMSDALAFEYLKREPEYAAKQQLAYDDNANVYTKSARLESLLQKYAQQPAATQLAAQDLTAKMQAALLPYGYGIVPGSEVRIMSAEGYVDVQVKAGRNAKWQGTGHQAMELKKILDPLAPPGMQTKPTVSF